MTPTRSWSGSPAKAWRPPTPEERAAVYQEFNDVAAADHFHIVLCNGEAVFVTNPAVQNLVPTLGGSYNYGVSIAE